MSWQSRADWKKSMLLKNKHLVWRNCLISSEILFFFSKLTSSSFEIIYNSGRNHFKAWQIKCPLLYSQWEFRRNSNWKVEILKYRLLLDLNTTVPTQAKETIAVWNNMFYEYQFKKHSEFRYFFLLLSLSLGIICRTL